MKKIIVILLLGFIVGCGDDPVESKPVYNWEIKQEYAGDNKQFYHVIIDSEFSIEELDKNFSGLGKGRIKMYDFSNNYDYDFKFENNLTGEFKDQYIDFLIKADNGVDIRFFGSWFEKNQCFKGEVTVTINKIYWIYPDNILLKRY